MARVQPVVTLEGPVAAFGNGKYRTPTAAGQSGKSAVQQQEALREVREAFKRVQEVHGGARQPGVAAKQANEHADLAAKISRNRKLGSRQYYADTAHAAELYHQRRRIQNAGSLTERKKNKLDPELYPYAALRGSNPRRAASHHPPLIL